MSVTEPAKSIWLAVIVALPLPTLSSLKDMRVLAPALVASIEETVVTPLNVIFPLTVPP